MGADGKPKIDAKDDAGSTNDPHKSKVRFSTTSCPFWLLLFFHSFVFVLFFMIKAHAASAHCFPVVFSPHLMICLTFTIHNVFPALFLPRALFSLADVVDAGKGKAWHLQRTHVKIIFDTENERAQICVGSFYLLWRRQSLRYPSQSHTASNMHTHAHRSHCTMLTSHFGLHMQLSNSSALCSFLTRLLVLLNDASPAHKPPSLALHVYSLQIPVFSFADYSSRAF